jgi:hypothetical protein
MNVYLLAQLPLRKQFTVIDSRILAALGTLAFGIVVEYLQYLGFDILGNTFDPWDPFMYAMGVGLGLGLDISVLDRWEKRSSESSRSDGKLR